MDAKEKTLALISSTASCNLAAAATTEKVLYTVPTGVSLVPVMAVLHTFSAAAHATPAIISIGLAGTCNDFIPNNTLSGITANFALEAMILQPVPNTTPTTVDHIPAASVISMEIQQANGAALTCTIDLFGYLF
jgi:hypothetical protein